MLWKIMDLSFRSRLSQIISFHENNSFTKLGFSLAILFLVVNLTKLDFYSCFFIILDLILNFLQQRTKVEITTLNSPPKIDTPTQ